MSHWTQITTVLNDKEIIEKAIKALGLNMILNGTARGYGGKTEKCDIVIKLGNYDVGLKKQSDGTYEMVADFFTGEVEKHLGVGCQKLLQKYAELKIIKEARRKGWMIKQMHTEDGSGEVKLSIYRL